MTTPALAVEDLVVRHRSAAGTVHAVEGITFSVAEGETLGIVGESGCGKSTLARTLVGLRAPDAGRVLFRGRDLADRRQRRRARPDLQMVFQDPAASLNPHRTVRSIIAEGRRVRSVRVDADAHVDHLMRAVGLDPSVADRRPHELSGGQCQRVAIARTLLVEPAVLVCDEAVSALDVSVQAQILTTLADVRAELGLTMVFVSHDLAVVRHISDRVLVMYLGTACEIAPSDRLFEAPAHPYTRGLIASAPDAPEHDAAHGDLAGEPPSPLEPPGGCVFHPRCPVAPDRCRVERPRPRTLADGHEVACHHPLSIGAQAPPVPVTVGPRG